jgi:LuxR family maltose regulon positive regulatory protein
LLSAANAYLLYLGGLKDSAEEHIVHVYKALDAWAAQGYVPEDGYDYSALPAEMAVLRANLATRKGDFQKGMEAAQEALRVAPQKAQVQGIAWNALSHAYRELGNFSEAIPSYQRAIRWNQASGNIIAVSLAARYLSRLFQVQGDLHQAEETISAVLEQADQEHQVHLPAYGLLYLTLGEINYERNDMKKARQWLEKGLEQGKPGGSLDLLLSAGILEARLRRVTGDLSGAIAILDETFRSIHRMDEPVTEKEVGAWQMRYQAEAGQLQDAAEWIKSLPPPTNSRLGLTHGIGLFSQVRVLLAMGQFDLARDQAARLENTATATSCLAWESEALLLQAEAYWIQSNPDPALRKLSQALAIAEPRGFTRLFLDEGRLVAAMLKGLSAQTRDGNRDRAARLLDLFPITNREKESQVFPAVWVPLSGREIEVLSLMAAGFSNPEIAKRLVVSTATVKTHIRHIYDKLDVQNRAEAVAQAKEKGLI